MEILARPLMQVDFRTWRAEYDLLLNRGMAKFQSRSIRRLVVLDREGKAHPWQLPDYRAQLSTNTKTVRGSAEAASGDKRQMAAGSWRQIPNVWSRLLSNSLLLKSQ